MKRMLYSEISCPKCNYSKLEEMPINNCQIVYFCEKCNERMNPEKGDCCVYCTYGTVPCPTIQENKNCCK